MKGKFNISELVKALPAEPENPDQAAGRIEIVMEDVRELIPSEHNFYRVDDSLKSSIELLGILQPLLIRRTAAGKEIIAGHKRRAAVISLLEEGKEKFHQVPCIYQEEGRMSEKPEEGREIQELIDRISLIAANDFREKTDYEKMLEVIETEKTVQHLKKKTGIKGSTREILGEILKNCSSNIGRYKTIHNNLCSELTEAFRNNRIGISVASEAAGLPEKRQHEAAEWLKENGALSLEDVRMIKGIVLQEGTGDSGQTTGEESAQAAGAEDKTIQAAGKEEKAGQAAGEYQTPHPEGITSICYSCTEYKECNVKSGTCTSCDQYSNRREAHKTAEQRYSEEQSAIDRETAKKLRERAEEKRLAKLPSEEGTSQKVHQIKIAAMYFDDADSGKKPFELRKNDREYRVGDILEMAEFENGKETGRITRKIITFMIEDYMGLVEGYCILGTGQQDKNTNF